MPRIWLRLELFEHGLLQLPSKYAATLTVENIRDSLDALHTRLQQEPSVEDTSGDVDMEDTGGGNDDGFVEADNLRRISFALWKETVAPIFQWRDKDYIAFWLLLVQFHRHIPVSEELAASGPESPPVVLDQAQCLQFETVPVCKVVIFLFIQTVKPHSWRSKYALESFNAVRSVAATLPVTPTVASPSASASPSPSPVKVATAGNVSPQFKGSSSPPAPPQSPHTMGMTDRSTSDGYYLEFVRETLGDLFDLLYPSAATYPEISYEERGSESGEIAAMDEERQKAKEKEKEDEEEESLKVICAAQIDLLGFLLCAGGRSMLDVAQKVSAAYPKWQQSEESPFIDTYKGEGSRTEHAAKLCRFFKAHLYMNETLYPPVGFSLSQGSHSPYSSIVSSTGREFSLADIGGDVLSPPFPVASDESTATQRPTLIANHAKTTVIKRADEFGASAGQSDLVIFSCHDTIIYVLGPVRIVVAPNAGIFCADRCEHVQITTIAPLIRVSNCLDSVINSYTPLPLLLTGENINVQLGPFNTKYPGMHQQFVAARMGYHADSPGAWDSYFNLEDESEYTETEKEPIALQAPASFREVCVPVKITGQGPAERPFPLPPAYAEVLVAQQETVEALRKLVSSDDFDLSTKRTMEIVIQMRFKEWLASTGNVRQIMDLVQIEKARGVSASSSSNPSSPFQQDRS